MRSTITIDKRNLYEQVAEHLEEQILAGVYEPGDRLPPERELQEIYSVGRPAIREALITLQRSGLIVIGNGGPARVSMATAETLFSGIRPGVMQMLTSHEGRRQLQGLRQFAEIGLVRNFAVKATEEDIADMDAALEHNKASIGDPEAFKQTDVEFHFVFAKALRNPAFVAIHDAMSDWLESLREVALREPGFDEMSYREHVRIGTAIRKRDPDKAEAAMRKHLESGAAVYWRQIERLEGGGSG